MQHFILDEKNPAMHSVYLSTLFYGDQLLDHPQSYSAQGPKPLQFALWHGRFDPNEDMIEMGFKSPSFGCLSVIHDTDRVLLQHCDVQSLELAQRMGLQVVMDTILLDYHDDMLVIPKFRDGQPAYFGDHDIRF